MWDAMRSGNTAAGLTGTPGVPALQLVAKVGSLCGEFTLCEAIGNGSDS